MKKIAKLSLVAAAAISASLYASGLQSLDSKFEDGKMTITTGEKKTLSTVLIFTKKELSKITTQNIKISLDSKNGTIALIDSKTGKQMLEKHFDAKLIKMKLTNPIQLIASYSKSALTFSLSKDGSTSEPMTLLKGTKQKLSSKKWSLKLKDGKISIGKTSFSIATAISQLVGCNKTDCKSHLKTASIFTKMNSANKNYMFDKAA